MPPQKKPPKKSPIRNHATTGKPTTPSGSGVVLGRTAPRNTKSPTAAMKKTANNSTSRKKTEPAPLGFNPHGDWWANIGNQSHEQPHDMMRLSAGLHNLADSLYRPTGRPSGKSSGGLADRRLYEGNGAKGNAKVTNKTVNKKSRTAAKMPNGRSRGN